jgi:hypothetical protein
MPQLRHHGWRNRHRKSPRSTLGRSGRLLGMRSPLPSRLGSPSRIVVANCRPEPSSRSSVGGGRETGRRDRERRDRRGPGRRPRRRTGRRAGRRAVGRGGSRRARTGLGSVHVGAAPLGGPRGSAITKTHGSAIAKTVHWPMGRGVLTSASRSTSLSRSSNICSRFARVGWSGPMPRVASLARQLVPVAPDCRGLRAGCAGAGEGIPPGQASGLDHGSAASPVPGSIEGSSFTGRLRQGE